MNFFTVIGFILAVTVLLIGFKLSSDDISIFLDYSSMFIVVGGTFAATAISFQLNRLFFMIKIFFIRVIKGKKEDYRVVIKELMSLCEAKRSGESLSSLASRAKDPFIKEALQMHADGLFNTEYAEDLLEKRAQNVFFHYKCYCCLQNY